MFELISAGGAGQERRATWPIIVSTAAHVAALTSIIVVSVVYVSERLPQVPAMMAFVAAPPPPPPPPPPAPRPEAASAARTAPAANRFAAPVEAPSRVEPETGIDRGLAGGVPGGVEGGITGGVIGGVVGGLPADVPPPPPPPSCGNGILEAGEQCDDHNNTNGDGCSASCQIQTLTSVTVDTTPTSGVTTVHKGLTQQYAATASYSDGWTQVVTASSTWATGSSTIATITTGGLLTATNLGTTSVSATFGGKTGSTNVTVDAPVVTGLVITPPSPSIAQLTQQQFAATAIFSDATTQDVTTSATWSSATPTVATIGTNTGLATALAASATSTTVIGASYTASTGTFTDSTTLTVTNATISSIDVQPANFTMAVNTTQQYSATGTFSDGTTQDLTTQVTWGLATTGHGTPEASVSATGLVTALKSGTINITAQFQSVIGSTLLTVSNATLQKIVVTPSTATVPKGFTQQFTATATYQQGTTTFTSDVTKSVTWSSSNSAAATITNKGLATSQGAGTSTITATLSGVSGTATFTGNNATLTSIAITPNPVTLVKGNSQQLVATGTFNDSGVISTFVITTQVSWTTSDKSIARPNKTGSVKASKAGTATITATKNNVQGTVVVTVN